MGTFRKLFQVLAAVLVAAAGWGNLAVNHVVRAAGTTYFVSTSGDDDNDGRRWAGPSRPSQK